eukprot:7902185-Pyramimonas_sp.AAC.1
MSPQDEDVEQQVLYANEVATFAADDYPGFGLSARLDNSCKHARNLFNDGQPDKDAVLEFLEQISED